MARSNLPREGSLLAPAPARAGMGGRAWRWQVEDLFPYLLVTPVLGWAFLIIVFPFIYSFYLSLTSLNLNYAAQSSFIGLENYAELFQDALFWQTLRNTFIFLIVVINAEYLLGFAIALLLAREFRGKSAVRTLFMMPLLFAPVLVGLQFKWLFADRSGAFNAVLMQIGLIDHPIGWLSDTNVALVSVMVAEIWQNTPFVVIVMLAGLSSLPREPFEAAMVDGASAWQRLRYLTYPMLLPISTIVLVIRTIDAARIYDIVMVMTRGGPANSTEMMGTLVQRLALVQASFGYGSAMAFVNLAITLISGIVLVVQVLKVRER